MGNSEEKQETATTPFDLAQGRALHVQIGFRRAGPCARASLVAGDALLGRGATQPLKSGQAIIEFMIGLVAILAIFAGMVQLVSLTKAQTETMTEARENAAEDMMIDVDPLSFSEYIKDWQEGGDEKQITADDEYDTANPFDLQDRIVDKSVNSAEEWAVLDALEGNQLSNLHGSAVPSSAFGLIEGRAETREPIGMIPAVRHLFYNADSVNIECEAWMIWTKGIY